MKNSVKHGCLLPLSLILLSFSASASEGGSDDGRYPMGPDAGLTPGELCSGSSQRRYPERILYCSRAVGSARKDAIVETYDRSLGYKIEEMGRQRNFKIDHYIPLCMGGANTAENLWPQHLSISAQTDLLEQVACEKMAEGKLLQADAIVFIKTAKNNLGEARVILKRVQAL